MIKTVSNIRVRTVCPQRQIQQSKGSWHVDLEETEFCAFEAYFSPASGSTEATHSLSHVSGWFWAETTLLPLLPHVQLHPGIECANNSYRRTASATELYTYIHTEDLSLKS